MLLKFYKYQGTGNDFIMVDNRKETFPKTNTKLVATLCDRKFGIGADGLILLDNDPVEDFRMIYYNSDGRPGSMCGNGGRCLVAFAKQLGVIDAQATFTAVDGLHEASIEKDIVSLRMQDVAKIDQGPGYTFLDTGSPHHVQVVNDLANMEVYKEGKRLRYDRYGEKGSNINFVELLDDGTFSVRTYERGVEDETLSCGTGVTATALAMHKIGKTTSGEVSVKTQGGKLKVKFDTIGDGYHQIYLIGPAKMVYKGEVLC
ncbi:diaminopimelate epimerase [Flavobacteriaceae bacterium F89]|uniref:Diaminopimelate epimerase n=1 Tax=Cerina litoralis TaxID=2874477 RepID=A0AAE3JNL0_9FLAO|nr:diaminopimelate epimerase [Cerina litoralis]MCG2461085.1 diaminopimelate epimerase [Cerina litoralis]